MGNSALSAVWWILFLPLAGALFQALFGKRIIAALGPDKGRRLVGIIAITPVALGFVFGLILIAMLISEPAGSRSHILTLYNWIDLQSIRIPFEALVDPLSVTMTLIITGVGALIHLYSTGYMAEDRDYSRFFTYLNLFISCMLILVLANNLVLMFIGWEGVGLCSYLLIGFWHKDINNAKAANKAFIVNRIGDWGMNLGMFLLFSVYVANAGSLQGSGDNRWLSYDVLLPNAITLLHNSPVIATAIALLLFVGACGKSAQFPLHFWLPDAMAGPTPVSALIHAATMVTAGVFMVNRMHVFFELSAVASAVVVCIGAFTALFAALVAFGQADIKKVLAYSTISQLGFMFVACGAGAYWAGMFHVVTHAFFKALLFLGAGAVISAMAHNQDMRNYGNLFKYLKITGWTMIVAWLAISGIPPLAGFYSKEAIIGGAFENGVAVTSGYNFSFICGWVALFAAMLTAWYMTRLTMLTFFGKEERWRSIKPHHEAHPEHAHAEPHDARQLHDEQGFYFTDEEMRHQADSQHEAAHHELDRNHQPKEVSPSMWFPLVVLAVLSLVAGFILARGDMFKDWLYPNGQLAYPAANTLPGMESHVPLTLLSIIAASLGLLFGFITYWRGLPKSEGWDLDRWSPFRRAAANQFGYDAMVMNASVEGGDELATNVVWKLFDTKIVDGIVNGIGRLFRDFGSGLRVIQTGYVRNYAMMMAFGAVLIIWVAMVSHMMGAR